MNYVEIFAHLQALPPPHPPNECICAHMDLCWHKHQTQFESILWHRIWCFTIHNVIQLQTKHTLHVAEFIIHMTVVLLPFRIVPFTVCIGIQLESCIYHLKWQEYTVCVVTMKYFHILKVSGCAEENQKQVPWKMFDKLEKLWEFRDSYSFFHEQKWVCEYWGLGTRIENSIY